MRRDDWSYADDRTNQPADPAPLLCDVCGEDRVTRVLSIHGMTDPYRLCRECEHDDTAICGQCGVRLFQEDGVRLYSSPTLFCSSCASQHPAIVDGLHRELMADMNRGK